jgi:hypothetical protein
VRIKLGKLELKKHKITDQKGGNQDKRLPEQRLIEGYLSQEADRGIGA